MTAYLMLMGDSRCCTPELRGELDAVLLAAGQRHLGGLGKLHGFVHPPYDAGSLPIELSREDQATQSWRAIPEGVSFIDIDNGMANLHDEGSPFSDSCRQYLRAFFEFCRACAPGGLVGYVLWWDGRCEDMPALSVRSLPSTEDLLAAVPELRVVVLSPA